MRDRTVEHFPELVLEPRHEVADVSREELLGLDLVGLGGNSIDFKIAQKMAQKWFLKMIFCMYEV